MKKFVYFYACLLLLLSSLLCSATPDPHVFVLFGGTGDLAKRKIVPALASLSEKGMLPDDFVCVGVSRDERTDEQYRLELQQALRELAPAALKAWDVFRERIVYFQADLNKEGDYERLKGFLSGLDTTHATCGNRLFYLSIPASYFATVIRQLHDHDLTYEAAENHQWSRVIIEKPFGRDTQSAIELQDKLSSSLSENQTYRIDHYLGKEIAQNLLTFRSQNPIFQSVWDREHIESIQINISEEIGIGSRGAFFEETGMLRDMVQNHAMQLLSLVAMELPASLSADEIREEKVKLLEAIRPFALENLEESVVRGQYGPGYVGGKAVVGYRQEDNVAPDSNVETFVAAKLFVDNERWEGVPMYVRVGKRLSQRLAEIVVTFRESKNTLVFRIQPDEEIYLTFQSRLPGLKDESQQVKMSFNYASQLGHEIPEAYERLIFACMQGDQQSFVHFRELLAAWLLWTPVLEAWQQQPADFPNYDAGSNFSVVSAVLTNKADFFLCRSLSPSNIIYLPSIHKLITSHSLCIAPHSSFHSC